MNARWNIISPNDIELIKADCAVRTVEFHRELPTTNDLALQRATLEELDASLLVLTEFQTVGRGRFTVVPAVPRSSRPHLRPASDPVAWALSLGPHHRREITIGLDRQYRAPDSMK